MNNIYQHNLLQERQSTPLALTTSETANLNVSLDTKQNVACRSGNTNSDIKPNVGSHSVFVLNINDKPLTPTTSTKARKLLKNGKAKKVWSKFNTFGIQLLDKTREEIPNTTLGYDPGTKFEGMSIVCDNENNLSVKLDLPYKKNIVDKLKERKKLRKNRRYRNCRKREARFNNRNRKGFITPSQMVVVNSRLKVLKEFCKIYPIQNVAMEDVCFNHYKHKGGSNFSTIEIGKNKIREFFKNINIKVFEYKGYETAEIRKKYGYTKTSVKSVDKFSAHCSDSLALAVDVNCGMRISEGKFLTVDDTYRCDRRKISDIQLLKDGLVNRYFSGNVKGLKKGIIIGTKKGTIGQLCGIVNDRFRYYNINRVRQSIKELLWVNNQFKIKFNY